jgi:hypothetical protein
VCVCVLEGCTFKAIHVLHSAIFQPNISIHKFNLVIFCLNSPPCRFYRSWTAEVVGSPPCEVNWDFIRGATNLKQITNTSLKYRVKIQRVAKFLRSYREKKRENA